MASKAENMHKRHTFVGGVGEGGSGVRDMARPTLAGKFIVDTKFSENLMSFPHFKTYFMPLLSSDNNLNHFIPIILLCLRCSLCKVCGP